MAALFAPGRSGRVWPGSSCLVALVSSRGLADGRTHLAASTQRGLGSIRSNPSAPWRHVDFTMVGAVLSIAALGCVMVFSATRGADPEAIDTSFLGRQVLFVALGIGVAAFTAWFDYRRLRDFAMIGYVAVVASLFVVISPLGTESKGTQAWFEIGSFQLQPSEFAKLILIVAVASLLAQFAGDIDLARLVGVLTRIAFRSSSSCCNPTSERPSTRRIRPPHP